MLVAIIFVVVFSGALGYYCYTHGYKDGYQEGLKQD